MSLVSAFAVYKKNVKSNKNKGNVAKLKHNPQKILQSSETKQLSQTANGKAAKKKKKNLIAKKLAYSSVAISNNLSESKHQKLEKVLSNGNVNIDYKTSIRKKLDEESKSKISKPKQAAYLKKSKHENLINNSLKKVAKDSPSSPVYSPTHSAEEGYKLFRWLLQPVTVEEFMDSKWEKSTCLIQRNKSQRDYFKHLISFTSIDQMLLENHVEFTKNIDITSYQNGVRETLNPEGRALPPVVWDFFEQGCSIRLLNPQTFLPAIFSLNTTLQEYFNCFVGANVYLTPPNSQGFAPHYDDIEAFVLQVEGRKRWKLYEPRNEEDMLPRYSSRNFSQNEIGKPILDEVLKPGDILYFPRGTIHQACTEPGHHSLHITLSVYQKNSYADLLENMMPLILQHAIASSIDLRRGLPLHTFHHAGMAFKDTKSSERTNLFGNVTNLMATIFQSVSLSDVLDEAVDQIAVKFQHTALPPDISPSERSRTVFGLRNHLNSRGECVWGYEIILTTKIRLLRANILRLVTQSNEIRIYYSTENSKEYCQYDPNFIPIGQEEACGIKTLIKSYPHYIEVSALPLKDDNQKLEIATALWERGLVITEKAFTANNV